MSSRVFHNILKVVPCLFLAISLSTVRAQAPALNEPVVARLQMQLRVGDKVVDVIDKGDLLTVVKSDDKAYTVLTYNGNRGLIAKENGLKLAEAVEIYSELIRAKKDEGRLYTLRASAWWARGDQKQALADYDRAIALGYDGPDAYASRGLFHGAIGNYDKALADHTMAIKLDPKDAASHINRAAVYMTQKKYELAIKDYDAAIRIAPKGASLYQQRAVAWKMHGQLDRALQDFAKAIELNPEHLTALLGRGFVWFQLEQHEKAIEDFGKVIKLDPKAAVAYNNRGYNYQLLNKLQAAMADYDRAIEAAPEYSLAYQNKAWLLATAEDDKMRNGQTAVEMASKACELNEFKNVGDLRALAAAFAENRQYEEAIGWQEKVIGLAHDDDKEFEQRVLKHYQDKKPYRESAFADKGHEA